MCACLYFEAVRQIYFSSSFLSFFLKQPSLHQHTHTDTSIELHTLKSASLIQFNFCGLAGEVSEESEREGGKSKCSLMVDSLAFWLILSLLYDNYPSFSSPPNADEGKRADKADEHAMQQCQ